MCRCPLRSTLTCSRESENWFGPGPTRPLPALTRQAYPENSSTLENTCSSSVRSVSAGRTDAAAAQSMDRRVTAKFYLPGFRSIATTSPPSGGRVLAVAGALELPSLGTATGPSRRACGVPSNGCRGARSYFARSQRLQSHSLCSSSGVTGSMNRQHSAASR